uniref:Uncharacterized protein n=1 Tax=Kalanchoe fedtschenkoi TaxID=63787 RepID=A0A7N0VEC8_KALFE
MCLLKSFDQDCTTLKSAALADSIKSIQTALLSSGIGIHDLDWNEFSDELLKPMKKVTLLLKEDIQKAEALTKGGKKNYDNRTGELKILKSRLGAANCVLQEANRDLMRLQNKTFVERRKEDLKEACDGDNILGRDESKPSCLEQMDLGNIDNELCKDVGRNSMKAIVDKDSCVEETVDSPYKCNAGQTPKLEDGCSSQSEQGIESEDGYKNEELDDFGDSELLAEDAKEAEEEKVVELSEIEQAKETTNNDNRNNLPAEPRIEKRKASLKSKKKEKRKTRKAQRKGERFVSCMKLPQACLASLGLYLIGYYLLHGCSFGFQ